MRAWGKSRGVTIIELMIAVAVLAVLVAMAAPSFERTIERRRMNGAAENIFAMVQYAKSEAIKQNRRVTVQFDANEWCLGVDAEPDPLAPCNCAATPSNCTVEGIEKVLMGADFRDIDLAVSGFGVNPFEFDPVRGMPSTIGEFEVSTPHNERRCVDVGGAGRIRIGNC